MAILEEVRGRRGRRLPVVMMSGHGNIETAVRATQLGAFDFIEKPLSFEKLLLTIRHALDAVRLAKRRTVPFAPSRSGRTRSWASRR